LIDRLKDEVARRRRAEAMLRERESQLSLFLDSIQVGVVVIDAETHRITNVNLSAARLFGASKDRICGSLCHQLICPAEAGKCPVTDLGQDIDGVEHVFIKADGATIPTLKSIRPILINGRKHLVESFVDLTERVRIERQTLKERNRAQRYLDIVGVMLMAINANQEITMLNRRGREILGCEGNSAIGQNWFDNFIPERVRSKVEASFNRLMAGESEPLEHYENSIVSRSGEEKIIAWHSIVLKDDNGANIGILICGEDVTERRKLENNLLIQNKMLDSLNDELISQSNELMKNQEVLMQKSLQLEEASRVKSRFLASMSHELRTPLNAIIGFSELMVDGIPGEINKKQKECCNDILDNGHHLLSLINDILDISKVEAGRMEVAWAEVDFSEVANEAKKTVRPLLEKGSLALTVSLENDLPRIYADRGRVKQVLINLLSNAIKFTPAGGSIGIKAQRKDGMVQIDVTDNGVGISKKDQRQIFYAYTQGEVLPGKRTNGTGLGLNLCWQFVVLMGGEIWLESKLHKGSTFSFTLPLVKEAKGKAVKSSAGDEPSKAVSRPLVTVEGNVAAGEAYQAWRGHADHASIRSTLTRRSAKVKS